MMVQLLGEVNTGEGGQGFIDVVGSWRMSSGNG